MSHPVHPDESGNDKGSDNNSNILDLTKQSKKRKRVDDGGLYELEIREQFQRTKQLVALLSKHFSSHTYTVVRSSAIIGALIAAEDADDLMLAAQELSESFLQKESVIPPNLKELMIQFIAHKTLSFS